jgi:hypothetical protein
MQSMPELAPDPLITLLRDCVVRIDDGNEFRGSGFFVAPRLVLTCGHVVHGAHDVQVSWQGRSAAPAAIHAAPPLETVTRRASYPLPDLALLDLGAEAEEWAHPCVHLTTVRPPMGTAVHLAGYTAEHDGAIPALTGATTELESLSTEPGHTLYKLKSGQVDY